MRNEGGREGGRVCVEGAMEGGRERVNKGREG